MSNINFKENSSTGSLQHLWYPPGGFLMWVIVLAEIFFFGIAFAFVARFRAMSYDIFKENQLHLNLNFGIFLTVCLLLSGWQLAEYVHHRLNQKIVLAKVNFFIAVSTGFIFVAVKLYDFYVKIENGHTFGSGDFWDLYWFLTVLHFIHVLVGLMILIVVYSRDQQGQLARDADVSIRAGALFWHMCDVIWLFIFPLFYLGIR